MRKFLWFRILGTASLTWMAWMVNSIPPVIAANPPATTYQPGFWQPVARLNPATPITIQVINQSDLTLEYGLSEQRGFSQVQAGATGRVYTKPLPMHLLIYPAKENRASLQFKVTISADNTAYITVIRAPEGTDGDLSISIDQYGAIYIS